MDNPAVWGFFYDNLFRCLQGEQKGQPTCAYGQPYTQTHAQRLYCYGINMYV